MRQFTLFEIVRLSEVHKITHASTVGSVRRNPTKELESVFGISFSDVQTSMLDNASRDKC